LSEWKKEIRKKSSSLSLAFYLLFPLAISHFRADLVGTLYKRREAEWEELAAAGEIIASGIGLPSPNIQELSKDKETL
jgi:hypothetical protein